MLGAAVRIAERIGIHNEAANIKCTAFDAEMRRRLWWSIVHFDFRVCEKSNNVRSTILTPTWDCKLPANLNDFEIRPDMKSLPATRKEPTEALFAVVRNAFGDFLRNTEFQLDFINSALKVLAKDVWNGSLSKAHELNGWENMVNNTYLKHCDPENPLHYMTIWTVRSQLAKNRLLKHYWTYSRSSAQQTSDNRDTAMSYALEIIECEAMLINSPLTEAYRWHISHCYFPVYIHIVQDLRKRPTQRFAEKAWTMMSDDFRVRFENIPLDGNPIFLLFAKAVVQAWEAREAAMSNREGSKLLWIVAEMKRLSQSAVADAQDLSMPQADSIMGVDLNDFLPTPAEFDGEELLRNIGPHLESSTVSWAHPNVFEQPSLGLDMDDTDWTVLLNQCQAQNG